MRGTRRIAGALALLCATAVVGQEFRIDEVVEVELQQSYVTVTGDRGRVLDLEQGDFQLRDAGREQKIVTFASGDIPFTAVLLVDASGSMWGERLQVALQGARAFTGGMGEKDEAKVMLSAERLQATTPFSGDPAELHAALAGATAGKGTAFRDQLYLSLLLLERRLGRRVIVLLSDGWDAHSVVTEEQLARLTRRSQALIYWVRVGSGEAVPGEAAIREGLGRARLRTAPLSAWRDSRAFDSSVRQLRRVVARSGGRVVTVPGVEAVEESFREILRELREQYALGYYPDPTLNDGSWREVRIDVARAGVRVRTREGYVDR